MLSSVVQGPAVKTLLSHGSGVEDQRRGEPAWWGRAEACTPVMKADLVQSSVTSITWLGGSKYAKTRVI